MDKPSLQELLNDVAPKKLDQPCAEEHLCEIALSVTEWQSVAPFLGLTKAEQEEIEQDCRGTRTQRIEMLRRWRQKFARRATYRRLAKIFYGVRQTDLVEELCGLLQESQSDSEQVATHPSIQQRHQTTNQEMAPCEPENPVVASYAKYLRGRYRRENPAFLILQWPPPPTRKVFNLAMILQKTARCGPIDEELVRLTLRGNVDDIMERKTPVKVEEIFKLDRKAHMLSNEVERKLILIEGAPGAGKSTLAWYIPQKWARGELFQEFKVVVFIQLRDPEVQAAQSLADLLPAKDRATAEKMASELRESEVKMLLFVLDSWDEFSPQLQPGSVFEQLICNPHKLNLHFSAVLITSRPIASGVLYPHVSSRVEIVGFTPTERGQYFKEVLKGDSQKLQDCLNESPVIEASCYLPLNAAIVAHLFLALNRTLPNTLHGVFSSLVICCLIRHMKKVGITAKMSSLENIPPNIQQPLKNICTMAYHGVMENKATFSASDLQSFDLPTDLSTLSLIQGVESFTAFEETRSYNFLHLSIQELLAAFHISKLPESEQICILKELFGQPRFAAVFQYYASFSKLQAEGIRDVLANIVKSHKAKGFLEFKPLLLSLLHCLYEAQDLSLCQFVASQLNGELVLVLTSLSPVECLAVGYFLHSVCLTTSGEFKVGLSHSSLDDYSVSFLVRGLSKPSSSSDALSVAATDGGVPGCLELDLSYNEIHGRGAKWIAELLSKCCLIRKLNLYHNKLQEGEDGLRHLLQALLTNSSLVLLSLQECSLTITEDNGPVLAQMLQTNKTLKSLDLSHNNVSDVGTFYLAEGLKHNTGLEKLDLHNNKLQEGEDGLRHLLQALLTNSSLVLLSLRHCSLTITEDNGPVLAQMLQTNKTLKSLDLLCNNVSGVPLHLTEGGTDVSFYLAEGLKLNTGLERLNVWGCNITGKGAQFMSEALIVNTSLVTLNIGSNDLGDDGIAHIIHSLTLNTTLSELCLDLCELTEKGSGLLAQALKVNKSLRVLDIGENPISDTGATHVADVLRHNQSLKNLDVCECEITDRGVESLATALTVNSTLEELNLSENQFTDTGLVTLGDCLKNNRGLQILELQMLKLVTAEGVRQFVLCLQENCHLTKLVVYETAGGAKAVRHERELLKETRRQRNLPNLFVTNDDDSDDDDDDSDSD